MRHHCCCVFSQKSFRLRTIFFHGFRRTRSDERYPERSVQKNPGPFHRIFCNRANRFADITNHQRCLCNKQRGHRKLCYVDKEPLLVLVYLAMALVLSWKLTLLSFLLAPFMLLIISRLGLSLHKEGDLSQKLIATLTSLLQETISGIKVVRSFGMEKYEIGKFESHTKNYFKSILRMTHIRNLSSPVTEFLSILTAGVIIYYGGMQVIQFHTLAPERIHYCFCLRFFR